MSELIDLTELKHRMGYHKATFPKDYKPEDGPLASYFGDLDENGKTATGPLHAQLRFLYIALAQEMCDIVPPGREQALALTALEESLMRANQGVAMTAPLVEE